MAATQTSFKPGKSGNPRGRPRGKTARGRFREAVEAGLPGIIENLLQAAQGGDMQATKLILDRCIPSLKPTSDALTIPASGSIAEMGEAVIQSMSAGQCTPDAARAALEVLTAQAKLVEQHDLITRLERIEAWLTEHNAQR